MKIIFISPFVQYPPSYGMGVRNYHILSNLTLKHDVITITLGPDPTGRTDAWLGEHCISFERLPWVLSDSLTDQDNNWRSTLRRTFQYPTDSFRRHLSKALMDKLNFLLYTHQDVDLIFFDTQLVGQLLLNQQYSKPCILSLADVYEHQLFKKVKEAVIRPFLIVYLTEWLKTAIYEYRIFRCFQDIITVSAEERELISRRAHWARVVLFSNGVDTAYFKPFSEPNPQRKNKLIFVGTFVYAPNVESFFYFYKNIFPLIRQKCPDIQFVVVGHNPTDEMKKIAEEDPAVLITGKVDDVRPYYSQSSVAVIPLRTGSGTKLKTLEALAMGVPIVSTQIGCQGIDLEDGEHLLIADKPVIFAEKVIWLLENSELAQKMAQNGRLLVEQKYDWREMVSQFDEYISQVASK